MGLEQPHKSESENKPYHLDFSIRESGNEGSEEKPVLYYKRNGFEFRVALDILTPEPAEAIVITVTQTPEDVQRKHEHVLYVDVQSLAEKELLKRRDAYSEHFAN